MGHGPLDYETIQRIPAKPGVYILIALDRNGNTRRISRAGGDDYRGILYIGSSMSGLRMRIRNFLVCAGNQDKGGHIAGWTYCNYNFSRKFPIERIKVHWTVKGKNKCRRIEKLLLREYLQKFKDKPPLNFSIKRW